jgi:Membrane protein involved in the export of O-antigen and teichoic acid
MKNRLFFWNTVILTVSSVVMRLGNIWFRTLISGLIGAPGMGLYQLILSVFMLGIMISTSGIGFAVTRLVAEGRGTRSAVRQCLVCALALSFAAAALIFFNAGFIARVWISSPAAEVPLQLLAPGLPFIAVCSCLRGYFIAIRNTAVPVFGDFLEQAATIGAVLILLKLTAPMPAIMLGSTLGEVVSCVYMALLYTVFIRKKNFPVHGKQPVFGSIVHIAAPVLGGSFLRGLLSSAENILIPRGLRKYGANEEDSLAQYGVMQGMVMPILFFPSAFLSSLAVLLVPELAQANAAGDSENIKKAASRAFRFTLTFSFFVTTLLIVFADDLGMAFYRNQEAGTLLRIMAPIVPLMYLDSVVDGMLKGLDQQFYSMTYNFSDSIMRVILIGTTIPIFGIKAYIIILFFSEIYNASLSINRLLKVTSLEVDIIGWILTPAVASALLYYLLILGRKIFLPGI